MRVLALVLVLGCCPQKAPESSVVQGTVRLNEAPKAKKPWKIPCPTCAPLYPAGMPREDLILDKENRIQGAFVFVKKGLEGRAFEAPKTAVVLDQKGCRYEPHVLGIMPGQELLIRNSDPHRHCAQALPFNNREFLVGQDGGGKEDRRSFTHPEVMVRIKDSIHPWMGAWIGVVEHPYFAVTNAEGKYSIKGLPPGKYALEVWQEKSVAKEADVEITGQETRTLDFRLDLRKE